jgi:N-acetylglucosamine kinase-like BadF-type ATPase
MGVTPAAAVLAVDAGNSKTDVALVGQDGTVLGSARGGGFHPHIEGAEVAVAGLAPVVAAVARDAGLEVRTGVPLAEHVSACLANADLRVEEERLERAIDARGWGRSTYVGNDTLALLRSGVDVLRGIAVVCGAGINCAGVLPDGRTARFAAVGMISGDWGGGSELANEALWNAARADDGRGPATALAQALPAHFGLPSMAALIEALHLGEIAYARRLELTPVLFEVAAAGDDVARSLVRRQGEEIVTMATVAMRRLDLLGEPVDVILGGGVLTAGHRPLMDQIEQDLKAIAPLAVIRVVTTPPVLGAALLGLDRTGAPPAAHERVRAHYTPQP